MADISKIVKQAGVHSEKTALNLFGNAVEEYAGAPLSEYLRSVTGQNQSATNIDPSDLSFTATSYAASLANSQFRPKLKFLFRVEFLFKQGVLEQFGRADWQRNFAFLIKSVDRPKVDFDYEDINQYNFRTKVLKQIKHRDLTMTFMDDVGNNVYEFFRFMVMVHSPITRRSIYATQNIADAKAIYDTGSGMEFSEGLGKTNDFAHRGVINTDVGSVIEAIKVTQIFLNPQEKIDNATKQVSFFFINPRVVSFDLDDVNHETSEPNLFTMQFDYDFMVMSKMDDLEELPASKQVPPVGSAPGDAAPTGKKTQKSGGNDPYTKAIAAVGAKAVGAVTSQTIGRSLRKIPGLAGVADTLGSIATGLTKQGIYGVSKNVTQSAARPARDVAADSATAGPDKAKYTTSTGGFGPSQPSAKNGEN